MTEAPLPLLLEALRWAFILMLWAVWLAFRVLRRIVHGFFNPGRMRTLLGWIVTAALILVGCALVLVGWGWMELDDEAQQTALHADDFSDDQIQIRLKRKAFRQRFVEVLDDADAIEIQRFSHEGEAKCQIRIRIQHRPRLGSIYGPKIPIRIDVKTTILPPGPRTPLLDRLLD